MIALNRLFIRTFTIILVFIVLSSSLVTYFWFENIYLSHTKANLSQNIDALSMGIDLGGDFDTLAKSFKQKSGVRVTFVAQDGEVLAESDKDKREMDNHLGREEIAELQRGDLGWSVRRSDTTQKSYLYVAKKLSIGEDELYLRMGQDIEEIKREFLYLSIKMGAILIVSILLGFAMLFRINKLLEKETDNVLGILRMLLDKKAFEISDYGRLYEFNKINKLLNKIGKKLRFRHELKVKQNTKLIASNKQKSEIISAISHEFKNPIAIIKSYCETLQKEETNQEIRKRFLQKIEKNANKMNEIIDRLRLSMRLEENGLTLNLESINLGELVREISKELEQNFKNRNIKSSGEECIICADRLLLSIAIGNLIENALKYSECDVEVLFSKEGVSVKDRGLGIKEDDVKKITGKFYRVSKNSWNNSLGLGLNIVENIVKLHGFTLHIESKVGEGSIFSIKFTAK